MSSKAFDLPAILGGTPVRPAGPPIWPQIDDEVRSTILKLANSGDWGRYHGPHCTELCSRLAEYHSVEHVHLCSSGTAAVELALRGLGVGPGDEVILAGYDFKANFQNVLLLRAIPVLADLQPSTWQLDTDQIATAISPRTRAIIASHLHGGIVDIPKIRMITEAHGIPIVEDACQNPGAMLFGQRSGTWGDVGVMSFGGSKLLTAGRGGAVLTQRTDIAERIKRYVLRGNDAYPLSEMQAAVVIPQLERLDETNDQRRETVLQLSSTLKEFSSLEFLQLPTSAVNPAYYKLGLRFRSENCDGLSRDLFAEALRAEGIAIDPGFRSLHLIHASRRFRSAQPLTEASYADANILTLHHPVLLDGVDAIREIVSAIRRVHKWANEIATHDESIPRQSEISG